MLINMKKVFFIVSVMIFLFAGLTHSVKAGIDDAFYPGGEIEGGTGKESKSPLSEAGKEMGFNTKATGINPVFATIIQIALSFLGVIFIVLMVYGGYLWMTASGSEERVTKAKKLITAAIVGLLIVLAAYAITWFVVNQLSNQTLQL